MADVVRLTDLREPTFSADVQGILDVMGPMAEGLSLDADQLHRLATEQTGLSDFGPREYTGRLDVLLAALNGIEGLTPAGLLNLHTQLLQLLKNRLRLTDLLARHPEVRDVELLPPVIIAGLPRTGTTHLHNLLSAGPAFRSLPYWESIEPFPDPAEGMDVEPRRERTGQAVWFANEAMPYFARMHEMTTDHVHEEIQLLANDFSTMFFETIAEVPAWRDHYLASDQSPHYAHLRLQLQALQYLRGGRRWVLKSPQHLEQLPVLRLARYWADRLERMLGAVVADRDSLDPATSMDVRFDDFMADDLAMASRVYDLAGEPVTADVETAMTAFLASHQRDRHGRIDYRAEDIGLDADDLSERFAGYTARFLAPLDG